MQRTSYSTCIHPLWLGAILLVLPVQGAFAQPTVAPSNEGQPRRPDATETFLDRDKPTEQRLLAAQKMGYPDDSTQPLLLAIGVDTSQDNAIRWEALRRLSYTDSYIDAVIKILDDPSNGDETLDANLINDLTRRVMFNPTVRARQRWQAVVRKLLDDPRDKVRLQAYRVLVTNHDVVAIGRISESLAAQGAVPVPLPEAISLLDQLGATNHLASLRPYLGHPDPQVQAQAVHALAADRESRPKIIGIARDPQTPREVRVSALRALAREDETFSEYAIPIIASGVNVADVDVPVWRETLRALVGKMNYSQVEVKVQLHLAEVLTEIARGKTDGDKVSLSAEAEQVLVHLKRIFPAIGNPNGAK